MFCNRINTYNILGDLSGVMIYQMLQNVANVPEAL